MLLVINMTVAGGHMSYAHFPYKKLLCYHVAYIQHDFNNLPSFWCSYNYFTKISSSKRS